MAQKWIDLERNPISLIVHVTYPRFAFLDRGKGTLAVSSTVANDLEQAVTRVTKRWSQIAREADRQHRQRAAEMERRYKAEAPKRVTIRAAAFEEIPRAYAKASGDGKHSAKFRQIYYAARRFILEATGRTGEPGDDLKSDYFRDLLCEYIETHLEETKNWDVLFDDRGHFEEPHNGYRIGIGTANVREYLRIANEKVGENGHTAHGPQNRYATVLYCEKEGFDELFAQTQLASRYDLV